MTKLENELLARVAKLESQLNPPKISNGNWRPRDLTAGMSMPRSAVAEMAKTTAGVLSDVVADNCRRSSAFDHASLRPIPSQNGWRDVPLPAVPPGTCWIDALTGGDAKPYRRKGA